MKIEDLQNAPEWLKQAKTQDGNVDIVNGLVVWHGGVWHDGLWLGGVWHDGLWHGGDWRGGLWRGGVWHDGLWHGGVWHDGLWLGGVWHDGLWHGGVWHDGLWLGGDWRGGLWRGGVWLGGVWHGGVWHDGLWLGGVWLGGVDRLLYMSSILGIVFDAAAFATAYRTTGADDHGRYVNNFLQSEGIYRESDLPPAGSGTCIRGIHVTSAARAWTYFGVDPTCQMWRVRFRREDLLDCDGEKARIAGGEFTKIPTPFLPVTNAGGAA